MSANYEGYEEPIENAEELDLSQGLPEETPEETETETTFEEAAEPTIESVQAQFDQYKAETESYKKAHEVLDPFGGVEGFEPIKPVFDAIAMADSRQLASALQNIDNELFLDVGWHAVTQAPVAAAAALMKDPAVRQQVLAQDPEYQAFLQAKASGQSFQPGAPQQAQLPAIDLTQLDPTDPLYQYAVIAKQQQAQLDKLTAQSQQSTQQFQQQQQEQMKAQREQRSEEAEANFASSFAQEVMKVVKWSADPQQNGKYQQMIFNQVNVAMKADAGARAALKRVRDLAAANPNHPLLPGAQKLLQSKFNAQLKKEVAEFNPVFKGAANNLRTTHEKQQQIRTLAPGSGAQPRAPQAGAKPHDGTREATVNSTMAEYRQLRAQGKLPKGW